MKKELSNKKRSPRLESRKILMDQSYAQIDCPFCYGEETLTISDKNKIYCFECKKASDFESLMKEEWFLLKKEVNDEEEKSSE